MVLLNLLASNYVLLLAQDAKTSMAMAQNDKASVQDLSKESLEALFVDDLDKFNNLYLKLVDDMYDLGAFLGPDCLCVLDLLCNDMNSLLGMVDDFLQRIVLLGEDLDGEADAKKRCVNWLKEIRADLLKGKENCLESGPYRSSMANLLKKYDSENCIDTMLHEHHAAPCADQKLISRFHKIKETLGIKEEIPLFECQDREARVIAFYTRGCPSVTIMQNTFNKCTPMQQDFFMYHELRHHLQSTCADVRSCVKEYKKRYRMTTFQANEFDADTFALRCANGCSYCIQEIMNVKDYALFQRYDQEGYATTKGIEVFLKGIKRGPVVCDHHKAMPKYKLKLDVLIKQSNALLFSYFKPAIYSIGAFVYANIVFDWIFENCDLTKVDIDYLITCCRGRRFVRNNKEYIVSLILALGVTGTIANDYYIYKKNQLAKDPCCDQSCSEEELL